MSSAGASFPPILSSPGGIFPGECLHFLQERLSFPWFLEFPFPREQAAFGGVAELGRPRGYSLVWGRFHFPFPGALSFVMTCGHLVFPGN